MEDFLYEDLDEDANGETAGNQTGNSIEDIYGDLDEIPVENVPTITEERTGSPSDELYDEIYGVKKSSSKERGTTSRGLENNLEETPRYND
jgi:hypothetical protein